MTSFDRGDPGFWKELPTDTTGMLQSSLGLAAYELRSATHISETRGLCEWHVYELGAVDHEDWPSQWLVAKIVDEKLHVGQFEEILAGSRLEILHENPALFEESVGEANTRTFATSLLDDESGMVYLKKMEDLFGSVTEDPSDGDELLAVVAEYGLDQSLECGETELMIVEVFSTTDRESGHLKLFRGRLGRSPGEFLLYTM